MAINKEDAKDVKRELGAGVAKAAVSASRDGFDSNKRWGNSAQKGHGVNSPAMMEARAGFEKKKEVAKKMRPKGFPSDAQMAREIKSNSKRIASNPNHPIMKQEEAHRRGYRVD